MGLGSSLQLGLSALTASQAGIQVAGDNLANAATPGFHRRAATLTPARGAIDSQNVFSGRGVQIGKIGRQIDIALQSRLRQGTSQLISAQVDESVLLQVEAIVSDLTNQGLSDQLTEFFNAFSELANNPASSESRTLVVQQGESLAQFARQLRSDLVTLRQQVDQQLGTTVSRADELLHEIGALNRSISQSELGRAEDAGLRDQRDQLLTELSELIEINTVAQPNGAVDVFVGSTPILLGNTVRGIEVRTETNNGVLEVDVVVKSDQEVLTPRYGRIGGLLGQRSAAIQQTIDDLDALTANVIFEVNKIHSSGRSFPGATDIVSERGLPLAEQTIAFNDPANTTLDALPFAPNNGSFTVYVTDQATGLVQKTEVFIDLDGIDNTGAAGFADDTNLTTLTADLDAIGNLSATILPNGTLQLTSSPGFDFGFADDSSGVLATLGINTFFSGDSASDIGVREELIADPNRVVAGVEPGSNEAALSIAMLRERGVDSFGGRTILEGWRQTTERVAVEGAAAITRSGAALQVKESLEAQRAAVSGVSVDEESVNLLNYQRQYQAAARFISTVDELTQLLLSLV